MQLPRFISSAILASAVSLLTSCAGQSVQQVDPAPQAQARSVALDVPAGGSQCSSATACLTWINNGTGKAIFGLGMQGNGILGQTPAIGQGPNNLIAGVRGDELGLSVYGAGVVGTSKGYWGVIGEALNTNSNAGVYGLGSTTGMYADTLPASRHFEALFADGRGEAGIYSVADGRAPTGIFEQDGSGDALDVFGPLVVFDGATGGLMIDHNGNVTIGGTLITTSKCASSCGSSNRIALYASSTASPVIEDAGEAQLQDGHATVRLNPEFAAAIDPARPYIVTVTAEGENDGLYVASRASSSFTVRESHGGHSAIPFAYRITARPYGMSSTAQIHQISMPVQQVTVLRPHPLQ